MRTEIVKARPRHLVELAQNMRAEDAEEMAIIGLRPRHAYNAFSMSIYSRAALVDGRVGVVWGLIGDMLGTHAELWLLTTPVIERAPKFFISGGREEMKNIMGMYSAVSGMVAHSYTRARRYLEVLDFKIIEGDPFCVFTKEAD